MRSRRSQAFFGLAQRVRGELGRPALHEARGAVVLARALGAEPREQLGEDPLGGGDVVHAPERGLHARHPAQEALGAAARVEVAKELARVAELLQLDPHRVSRVVGYVEPVREAADLAVSPLQLGFGEVARGREPAHRIAARRVLLPTPRVDPPPELEHQPRIAARLDARANTLVALGVQRHRLGAQPFERGAPGAILRAVGEDPAHEHVEVARRAELSPEPAQLGAEEADPIFGQERLEQRERRARTPYAHPHLVHALGIEAFARAIGVRGEVREAVGEDRAESVVERRTRLEMHARRGSRGRTFAARQRITSLRLAARRGPQVEPLLQEQREFEQLRRIARAQLELDLVHGRVSLACGDPADVDVERPLALALAEHAPRAAELRSEDRDQRLAVRDLDQPRAQIRIVDPREVGLVSVDRDLELGALEQPAGRRALALDRLHAPPSGAPHAQAEVRRGEVVILGVEVDRFERLGDRATLGEAVHQRVAPEPPQVFRRCVELELDLAMGVHASRIPAAYLNPGSTPRSGARVRRAARAIAVRSRGRHLGPSTLWLGVIL